MGYIAEFWKTTKTGKYAGIPRFYKKLPVDNVTMLKPGNVFTIVNKKEVKYYIEKVEHVYHRNEDEYYVRCFIKRTYL